MVTWCCAYNCHQRYEKGITFHKFPKDPHLFQKWVNAIRRKDWKPTAASKLCSLHFLPSCYETQGWTTRKKLKPDAVPSIFDFSEHLIQKPGCRPSPKKRCLSPSVLNFDLESESVSDTSIEESSDTPIESEKKRKTDEINTLSLPVSNVELKTEPLSITSSAEETNDIPVTDTYFHIDPTLDNHSTTLTTIYIKSETMSDSDASFTEESNSHEIGSVKLKKKRNHFLGDFDKNNPSQYTHEELCKFLQVAQEKLNRKNKTMRLLRQTVRRQSNKIKSFDQLLDNLNKNLTSLETAPTIREG